jgi:hypothetical protein
MAKVMNDSRISSSISISGTLISIASAMVFAFFALSKNQFSYGSCALLA